jgi:hypothetical protein
MPGPDVDSLLRSGVASLCLAAGVLHVSAAADHRGMAGHVAFFVLVAVAQSALAAAVQWARPRRWLGVAAVANLAVAAIWVLSRTTGISVDGTSAPEAIGFKDGVATMLELGAVAGTALWWLLPEAARQVVLPSRRWASTLLGTGVWALGASGLFAGHTHSAGHAHEGRHPHGAAAAHAHPAVETAEAEVPHNHGTDHSPVGQPDVPLEHRPVAKTAQDGHDHGLTPNGGVVAASPASHHPHSDDRVAAGHHHGSAPQQAAGGLPPAAGHNHDDGHAHAHGSGDHHADPAPDRDRDRSQREKGRGDEDGGTSALDEVLKLIRPS